MRSLSVRITLLGLALAASPALGQASQTTLIPVQSWVHQEGEFLTAYATGYYGGSNFVWAPLAVPAGVEVDSVCVEVYDNDSAREVGVTLWGAEVYRGSNVIAKLAEASSGVVTTPGGTSLCLLPFGTFAFPLSVRTTADLDNSGSPTTVQYYLQAFLPGSTQVLLGPALVTWRRVVSDAPDTATFNDVPTNDPFYQYVEALYAAGVAGSCDGGTNFCPDSPVTRKQLALYLARALGLFWPN